MDHGPVGIDILVEFIQTMDEKLREPRLATRHIAYYTGLDLGHRSNAVFLLAAYLVIR